MCPRKNKSQALKVDKECRKGRTYDILAFQYGKKYKRVRYSKNFTG